jgi:hypothetical protein
MAPIPGGDRLLPVTPGRLRTNQRDGRVELRLVLLDQHDRIAPLVHARLRHMALGEARVPRHHPAFQDQLVPEGLNGRHLIGFVGHGLWRQRHAHVVCQRRSEVHPWRPVRCGAPQGFPLKGHRRRRRLSRGRQTLDDTVSPRSHVCFALVPIDVPKDHLERGRTRRGMGEAERLSEPRAIIPSPFGKGTRATSATQHRTTC